MEWSVQQDQMSHAVERAARLKAELDYEKGRASLGHQEAPRLPVESQCPPSPSLAPPWPPLALHGPPSP